MRTWQTIVAIDGPAAVGKSGVAKAVAAQLGFAVLDTGSLYRSIGLAVLSAGLDPSSAEDCATVLPGCALEVIAEGRTSLYGEEVPQFLLRGAMASRASSEVAQHEVVRTYLLDAQQNAFEALGPLVAEGRDIGTVIFPAARYKVFLTAREDVRKARMTSKLIKMGKTPAEAANAAADVAVRDEREMTRAISPLVPAEDAILIDTSDLTFEEVVEEVRAGYLRMLNTF